MLNSCSHQQNPEKVSRAILLLFLTYFQKIWLLLPDGISSSDKKFVNLRKTSLFWKRGFLRMRNYVEIFNATNACYTVNNIGQSLSGLGIGNCAILYKMPFTRKRLHPTDYSLILNYFKKCFPQHSIWKMLKKRKQKKFSKQYEK